MLGLEPDSDSKASSNGLSAPLPDYQLKYRHLLHVLTVSRTFEVGRSITCTGCQAVLPTFGVEEPTLVSFLAVNSLGIPTHCHDLAT